MRKIGLPILMALLVAVDQWVKAWTVAHIALHDVRDFLPGFLSLAYVRNYGAAYSILQNQQALFVVITIVVLSGAVWYFIKNMNGSIWVLLALSLIIAGGLGNFIDRLRLGYVVDMLQFEFINFPVFNIADVCLTVGVGLMCLCMMKEEINGTKD